MRERFYIHEDDWGRISLEPAENYADRARVVEEVRAFGEAHRAPGGIGWTDIMIVPASPVSLAVRAITLDEVRAALGPGCLECTEITTGYSTYRETVADGFAFRCSDEVHWDVIYGCVTDGVVTQLHVTHATSALADRLSRLGTTYRLILCDLGQDRVIDLARRADLDRYLADDDPA
jgi:hypothetical protein